MRPRRAPRHPHRWQSNARKCARCDVWAVGFVDEEIGIGCPTNDIRAGLGIGSEYNTAASLRDLHPDTLDPVLDRERGDDGITDWQRFF